MNTTVLSPLTYKGRTINKVEDAYGQQFVYIAEVEQEFFTVADAKRFINGQEPRLVTFVPKW